MTDTPVRQSVNDTQYVAMHGSSPGPGPIGILKEAHGYKGGAHDVDLCCGVTTELVFHVQQWGAKDRDTIEVGADCKRTRPEAAASERELFDDLVDALHDFAELEADLLHQAAQVPTSHPVVPHLLAVQPKWPIDVYADIVRGRPFGEATRIDVTDYWWYDKNVGAHPFLGSWVSQSPGGAESVARSRSMWFKYFFAGTASLPRLDVDFAVPQYPTPGSTIQPISGFVTLRDVPPVVASQLRKLLWRHTLLASLPGLPSVEVHCALGTLNTDTQLAPVDKLVLPLLK